MTSLMAPLRLKPASGEASPRKVTWLELFFDLIFVAAVAQVAEPLRHHYTVGELARLTPLFLLIWWAWAGLSTFSTRFGSDAPLERALTLIMMFAVAVMAANAKDTLDSESSAGLAAAYAVVRLILVGQYWRARSIPAARSLTTRYIAGHGTAAVIWLASALVPVPARFALWAVAFAVDLGTPWVAVGHTASAPPDASHLPERFGLFTIILLGESVIALMQGIESQEMWTPAAAGSAFLGMGTVFVLWWWYFDGVSGASERHVRSRADAVRAHLWSYAHFPLYVGIIVLGVGLRRIVSAASRVELEPFEAMLALGAAALVMFAMVGIGSTADDRDRFSGGRSAVHLGLACATIAIALSGVVTSPVALVVIVAGLCLLQLVVSLVPAASFEPGRRARVSAAE